MERIPAAYWVVGIILIVMPVFASPFVLFQIFAWSFALGLISLGLTVLAGYGGMVSLAQMTMAGFAGYMVAIFGDSAVVSISQGWPWYVSIPLAIALTVVFSTAIGWLAVRTAGIYTIMITLAVAAAFFYFTRQNYEIFNGFTGFNQVVPPQLFGIDWRSPVPFYYLSASCAVLFYLIVLYILRAPFGLALQGVRDNPRRMGALGYAVTAHRVAAYALAAVPAAVGGILVVWGAGQISPGTASIGPAIDILIIAVIGGLRHPIGPFIGALVYVVLKTFATDMLSSVGLDASRFNLLIGVGFLAIVALSPDGILGLWARWRGSRSFDRLTGKSS